jgi:RNA polymerase sigma-70 factor (ECF subfamily)
MQDVDDVVQDCYLKLLKDRPAGKIEFVKAYLFTTARNAALKVFRKRRIISDTPVNELPDWRVLDGGQNVVETANAHLRDSLVAEAAAQLPDRCREVFQLRVARGLSYAEIAAQLGIAEATVRVQVARGLTRCVQHLRDRGVNTDT